MNFAFYANIVWTHSYLGISIKFVLYWIHFLFINYDLGGDEPKPDEITTLLAVGIFIIKAPPDVVEAPNLQYPAINLLKQSLQSHNEIVIHNNNYHY
jgi:hypothetical protein